MTTKSTKKRMDFGQIIRKNKGYFLPYFLLLTLGVFLLARIPQGNENLYFVLFRGSIWDDIFKLATQLAEPIIILPIILISLFVSFRKTVSIITAITVTLIISGISKALFQHARPVLFFHKLDRLAELVPVEGIQLLTGYSSFPSGHTMAAFSIFTLLAIQAKQKKLFGVIYIILAAAVGLSRIYLGHHFLKDVIVGSIFGVIIALFTYVLFERLANRPKWNRNIKTAFNKEKQKPIT